jgi:hypothetical protein
MSDRIPTPRRRMVSKKEKELLAAGPVNMSIIRRINPASKYNLKN